MDGTVESVFIEAYHNRYGVARGSAMAYDNVIIAHGSLLYYFRLENKEKCISKTDYQSIMYELSNQVYFKNPGDITFNFKLLKKIKCDETPRPTHTYGVEDMRLCFLYKDKNLDCNSDFLMKWSHYQNTQYCERDSMVMPDFLFFMTENPSHYECTKALYTLLKLMKNISIHPGLMIAVESTPFANVAFYNSLARGIVSKTFGHYQEGFLIDARLVYGCEGAPTYVFKDGLKSSIIGIVVWVKSTSSNCAVNGFSFCLNLKHLLMGALNQLTESYISYHQLKPCSSPPLLDLEMLSSAVIFVRSQNSWGSGVVVDADLGLVLTCSHIIYRALDSVCVVVKGRKYPATVLYAKPPSEPYDLAVLRVENVPGLRALTLATMKPMVGETTFTVGYPLSTEATVMNEGCPTLSSGCVSKVSRRGGPLHTTCCAQPGMSGGAVLRPPDQLIGIVTANVCDGTIDLPFFCLAISVEDFRTAILDFIKTKTRNPACLTALSAKCPEVQNKWLLKASKL